MKSTATRLLSLLFVILDTFVTARRNQIGHVPPSGNLWRAKLPEEIAFEPSAEFQMFAASNCRTTTSEETNITYYYTTQGEAYKYEDIDDSICVYSIEKILANAHTNVPDDEMPKFVPNFTLYFACDDTCCAMECCRRDLEMSIMGVILIGTAVFILVVYGSVYTTGLVWAWRNGSLGRVTVANGRSPSHNGRATATMEEVMETSMTVIKNEHADNTYH